jgi:hypothetical protein
VPWASVLIPFFFSFFLQICLVQGEQELLQSIEITLLFVPLAPTDRALALIERREDPFKVGSHGFW